MLMLVRGLGPQDTVLYRVQGEGSKGPKGGVGSLVAVVAGSISRYCL